MAEHASARAAASVAAIPFPLRIALCAVAGAAAALAQPPWGLWPLALLGLAAVHALWRGAEAESWKRQFAIGWAFGAGYFGLALHWIVEPFLVDAMRHGWMAPFAAILLCGGLALFWGAAFALARTAARRADMTPLGAAAALVVFWTLAEIARGNIFTGFPWALFAYVWLDTPVAQTASLIGPHALSLATIAVGVSLTLRPMAAPFVCCALVAAGWFWGDARLRSGEANAQADGAVVRVLQTAIDQNEKWKAENVRPNLEMLLALSTEPATIAGEATDGAAKPAVVVWPETAVTFLLARDPDAVAEIAARLDGASVATGSLRATDGPDAIITGRSRWRNSLFMIDGDGRLSAPFDKLHLVPFGEFLPFDSLLNSLGIVGLGSLGGGIVPGEAHVAMTPRGAPPFSPLICYEMIFPRETMKASADVEWMVLVTNDSWFGGSAGLVQHLAKARLRAIETGVPIARSANAGISAMIDPYGRTHRGPEVGAAGFADSRLPRRVETAYRAYDELFTTLGFLVLLVSATVARKRRAKR
ncbi:MAG: apolipoprotein N-acyltransferase [Pseudomonadota bacterium]